MLRWLWRADTFPLRVLLLRRTWCLPRVQRSP